MSEHSKLPWKVVRRNKEGPIPLGIESIGYQISAVAPIVDFNIRQDFLQPYDVSEANAEFIVKAANNHDALVAALETLYVCAKNGYRIQPEDIEASEKALKSAK